MSGGALTNYNHDLSRLGEWAQEVVHQSRDTEWTHYSPEFKVRCERLADLMKDLEDLLYAMDYVFSGDRGEEDGVQALDKFEDKWFKGIGPVDKDLIDIKVYAENMITRVETIRKRCKE